MTDSISKSCIVCGNNESKDEYCNLYQCYECEKEDICDDCIKFEFVYEGDCKAYPLCSKCYDKTNLENNLKNIILTPLKTCSECKRKELDEADIFFECLDCGKINICNNCIKTLSQEGNHYYGCNDCSKEEAKLILLMKERIINNKTNSNNKN